MDLFNGRMGTGNGAQVKPETLRTYATIFEMPYTDHHGFKQHASSICMEMARCARLVADAIERDDPYLPPGWRNVQPKEST